MSANNTLENNSNAIPKDLIITGQPDSVDKDKFIFTIPDLKLDETYAFQFQYVFKDGGLSQWSPSYVLLTPTETVPAAPSVSIPSTSINNIPVTLNTYPANAKRVDIVVIGGIYGIGKTVDYFLEAGTKTISISQPGEYQVALYTVTPTGILGTPTSTFTITVTGQEQVIQDPTLPSGLTVASAPFAVSVNWGGQYSGSGFEGFKSIDIHVRGSDVGATATSGFSTTTQVATLTVDSTTNRQNIGLDNLRQALSLASNEAAYTAPMFFYYIARNQDDDLYSVGGTPTYTRINSSSVNPTQANLVDLANGLISIQNLVAGNGQFSSWLRVGANGGARIELSGADTTTPTGSLYPVQKGLVAYSTGNTDIFKLDIGTTPKLTIKADGEFTGSLSIGTGDSVFKADPASNLGIWLGDADWADANFRVSNTGILRARSGNIGGWQIDSTQLRSKDDTTGVNYISLDTTTPRISLVKQVSDVNSGTGTITIDPVEGIKGPNQTFTITRAGVPYIVNGPGFKMTPAGNADFLGTIHAASGYIGAWQITGNSIIGGSSGPFTVGLKVASNAPANEVVLWADAAKTIGYEKGVGDITIWAGSSEPLFGTNNVYTSALTAPIGTDSPFYVTNTGFLKASKGRIGGWFLGYTQLWGGNPDDPPTIVGLQALRQSTEFYSIWAGGNGLTGASANGGPGPNSPFSVTNLGNLRATNAYIRGTVLASTGGFGTISLDGNNNLYVSTGWTINSPEAGTIESTGYSTGTFKIRLEGSTGSIVGGNFYIGGDKNGDKILSDGTFRFGGGILQGTASSVTINGGQITMQVTNTLDTDNNNFAGDPTITINDNQRLTKGRRFIFSPGGAPTSNVVLSGNTGTFNVPSGRQGITVKVGDILFHY